MGEGVEFVRKDLFIVCFVDLSELVLENLEAFSIDNALFDQFLGVYFEDIGAIFDLFVHERLCEGGLILFVMAISSISDNIDEDIFLEALPVLHCDFHALIEDVWLIGVDVDDWCIDRLCHLSAVIGGPAAVGNSCKTDLVVKHDVDYASGTVVHQVLETERLTDYSLTSNCSVTVD